MGKKCVLQTWTAQTGEAWSEEEWREGGKGPDVACEVQGGKRTYKLLPCRTVVPWILESTAPSIGFQGQPSHSLALCYLCEFSVNFVPFFPSLSSLAAGHENSCGCRFLSPGLALPRRQDVLCPAPRLGIAWACLHFLTPASSSLANCPIEQHKCGTARAVLTHAHGRSSSN